MKKNVKIYYKYVFYSICLSVCNYVLLMQYVDAATVLVATLLLGFIFSYFFQKIRREFSVKKMTNEFIVKLMRSYELTGNIEKSFNECSIILKDLGFLNTYQDVLENPDLLNQISLGLSSESIKVFVQKPSSSIHKNIIIENAQHNIELLNKDYFVTTIKETLYFSLSFAMIFSLIHLIFGNELIDYSNMVFRIVSDIFYVMPITLVLFFTYRKAKQYEKSIY